MDKRLMVELAPGIAFLIGNWIGGIFLGAALGAAAPAPGAPAAGVPGPAAAVGSTGVGAAGCAVWGLRQPPRAAARTGVPERPSLARLMAAVPWASAAAVDAGSTSGTGTGEGEGIGGSAIGATSVIGDDVKLYQGVTLGAISVRTDTPRDGRNPAKRHPTLRDGVTVYAGSTILGGDTIVGARSVIGGNVWLTQSVAPDSKIYRKSDTQKK